MKFEDVKYDLVAGEEVRIQKGMNFHATPSKVVFVQEFPHHLLFEGTFERGKELYGPRILRFSIGKTSLWCGEIKVKRLLDGILVGAKEVKDDE